MKIKFNSIIFLIAFLIMSSNILPQERERKDVPDQFKWDLSILYKNPAECKADIQNIESMVKKVAAYKGKLGESADNLYNALRTYFDAAQKYGTMSTYSRRVADEDLRISANQALKQEVSSLGTRFSEATAFIEPEIIRIEQSKLDKFFSQNKGLDEFKFYIENIQRLKAHTLSPSEEQLLASAGSLTEVTNDVFNIFDNAEMPRAKVKLSNGEEVVLSASGYVKHRADKNREDRKKVMSAMFNNYKKYQNTLGANLAGKVRADYFFAKNRKYKTTLEASLAQRNIPVSVYTNLIEQINKNLPTLHRALELKKRMLGVDTLHYYDLYVPLVKAVEMPFTVEEGEKLIVNVLKPMGSEYESTLKKAFNHRWIDFYPNKGKRSGAYSTGGAYAFHPYILTNWTGDYESVSTLAHELGHSMHSYFTNKTQPYVNSGYATFVAEIASTLNENLLNDYMVKHAKSDDEKLYLLGSYLELLRTTIFRQTSFAEFEWEIHKRIENNQPLTGEIMSNIYYNIVKKYYGDDKGICKVDPYIAYEWEYIPHFLNYTYYVYQYSTSLIYSTAFAEKILKEGQPAVDKYYNILKGGGSDYPINLIKKAGLDPLSSEAFNLTMNKMNKVMDQMEMILNKKS